MSVFIEMNGPGGKFAIPHRAFRTEHEEDGGVLWRIEYDQARDGYFSFRGRFIEKADGFHYGGKVYETAEDALRARVYD